MKVLLIKTSSLGDLIHCMPAIEDLAKSRPEIELHWLVEEAFVDIPRWHPNVKEVFAYADRRWRKSRFSSQTREEIATLKGQLLDQQYDLIIDAQGLIKSALAVRWFKGVKKVGYDRKSIREPLASCFYTDKFQMDLKATAIARNRALFAWAFGYTPQADVQFGMNIMLGEAVSFQPEQPYAIFLHGTNWPSKVLPIDYWVNSAKALIDQGTMVYLPWSNADEQKRAEVIAERSGASLLPKMSLSELAYLLQHAKQVLGCDTGLSHIAAALDTPTVSLYGASNSQLTGLNGIRAKSLQVSKSCSPCMKSQCPLTEDQQRIPCYLEFPMPAIEAAFVEVLEGV